MSAESFRSAEPVGAELSITSPRGLGRERGGAPGNEGILGSAEKTTVCNERKAAGAEVAEAAWVSGRGRMGPKEAETQMCDVCVHGHVSGRRRVSPSLACCVGVAYPQEMMTGRKGSHPSVQTAKK